MGDNKVLYFSELGHQVVVEEDAEAGGGVTCVGVVHLVSIRVGGKLVNGSGS